MKIYRGGGGLPQAPRSRAIGRRLGRASSTVPRVVNTNGGGTGYRAVTAEAAVVVRARRPKLTKLAGNPALREVVEAKLAEFWSPEQIAGWLRVEYPHDALMWVSHEAIYLALYAKQLTARPDNACAHGDRCADVATVARTRARPGSQPDHDQ